VPTTPCSRGGAAKTCTNDEGNDGSEDESERLSLKGKTEGKGDAERLPLKGEAEDEGDMKDDVEDPDDGLP
jgi:hypothetical protein